MIILINDFLLTDIIDVFGASECILDRSSQFRTVLQSIGHIVRRRSRLIALFDSLAAFVRRGTAWLDVPLDFVLNELEHALTTWFVLWRCRYALFDENGGFSDGALGFRLAIVPVNLVLHLRVFVLRGSRYLFFLKNDLLRRCDFFDSWDGQVWSLFRFFAPVDLRGVLSGVDAALRSREHLAHIAVLVGLQKLLMATTVAHFEPMLDMVGMILARRRFVKRAIQRECLEVGDAHWAFRLSGTGLSRIKCLRPLIFRRICVCFKDGLSGGCPLQPTTLKRIHLKPLIPRSTILLLLELVWYLLILSLHEVDVLEQAPSQFACIDGLRLEDSRLFAAILNTVLAAFKMVIWVVKASSAHFLLQLVETALLRSLADGDGRRWKFGVRDAVSPVELIHGGALDHLSGVAEAGHRGNLVMVGVWVGAAVEHGSLWLLLLRLAERVNAAVEIVVLQTFLTLTIFHIIIIHHCCLKALNRGRCSNWRFFHTWWTCHHIHSGSLWLRICFFANGETHRCIVRITIGTSIILLKCLLPSNILVAVEHGFVDDMVWAARFMPWGNMLLCLMDSWRSRWTA